MRMTLAQYQRKSYETAKYPGKGVSLGLLYCTLGLMGEAGEVSEKIKKKLRRFGEDMDHQQQRLPWTEQDITDLKKELGDVMWYIAGICTELGIELEEVGEMNITKLLDRRERGVIDGEGDNR